MPTPYGPGLLVAVQRLAPESGGGSRAVVRLGWATVALWVGPDALGTPLDAGAANAAAATTAATPAATPRTPPRPAPAVAAVVSPAAAAAATPARPPPLRFNSVRIVTQCVVQLELIATAGELIAEHLDALAPAHVDGLLALLQVRWKMGRGKDNDGALETAGWLQVLPEKGTRDVEWPDATTFSPSPPRPPPPGTQSYGG